MQAEITYFEKPGPENTEETLRIARKRAGELGIKTVLVASTRGEAAVKAIEALKGLRVIGVSHATGYQKPNLQRFTEANQKTFKDKGGIMLTTGHIFGGLSRAMRDQFSTSTLGDIIANTLRTFGEGMKVCCEISMMAVDAGMIHSDEDVICVAGTGSGADTAVVITAVNSSRFFSLKVKEILCKPRF